MSTPNAAFVVRMHPDAAKPSNYLAIIGSVSASGESSGIALDAAMAQIEEYEETLLVYPLITVLSADSFQAGQRGITNLVKGISDKQTIIITTRKSEPYAPVSFTASLLFSDDNAMGATPGEALDKYLPILIGRGEAIDTVIQSEDGVVALKRAILEVRAFSPRSLRPKQRALVVWSWNDTLMVEATLETGDVYRNTWSASVGPFAFGTTVSEILSKSVFGDSLPQVQYPPLNSRAEVAGFASEEALEAASRSATLVHIGDRISVASDGRRIKTDGTSQSVGNALFELLRIPVEAPDNE